MAPRGVERKLAAILAADVVGYSRLMGDGTLLEQPLFNLPGLTSRRRHSGMAQRRISSHLP